MKKFIILFFMGVLLPAVMYSQEGYTFDYKIHPNRSYILKMDITSSNETTIDGDVFKSENVSKVSRTTVTKETNAQGFFPAIMAFEDVSVTSNGEVVLNPITNTIIEGLMAEDNKFLIDTIINPNLDKVTRDALKSVFKDLKPEIDFPKKILKIGEAFSRDSPVKVPLNGQVISVIMTKKYILNSVAKGIAEFLVEVSFNLEIPNENITAIGEGSGTVVFNLYENQVVKDNVRQTINVKMKTVNGVVLGYVNSISKKSTTIN